MRYLPRYKTNLPGHLLQSLDKLIIHETRISYPCTQNFLGPLALMWAQLRSLIYNPSMV
jgi:hypothetical protein